MSKKVMFLSLLFIFLQAHSLNAIGSNIEVFDIKSNTITSKMNTKEIQKEIMSCIDSITGPTHKFNPIPNSGKMIRIPLEPTQVVHNEWFNALIEEVILIKPINDKPLLLIYDDENHSHFFEFDYHIKILDL